MVSPVDLTPTGYFSLENGTYKSKVSVQSKYTPAGQLHYYVKRKNETICFGYVCRCCPYTDVYDFM